MEFVTFETAKKLKDKGFPQHICDDAYITENEYDDDKYLVGERWDIQFLPDYCIEVAAPTISQVLKWLREEKRIDAGAVWDNRDGKWVGYINEMDMPDLVGEYVLPNTHDTYEEAALAGVNYCLENLI